MDEQHQDQSTAVIAAGEEAESLEPDLVEHELLVEEVSIDGMCGVY